MRGCMGRISGLAGTVTTENRSPSHTPAIKNTGIPATWNSTSPCGDGSQIPRVGTRQRRARDQNPRPCFSCSKSFSLRVLKTGLFPVGGGKPHNRVRHSMPPAPPTITGAAPLGQTGSTVSPLGKPARWPLFHDVRAATTSVCVNGWNSCMCVAPCLLPVWSATMIAHRHMPKPAPRGPTHASRSSQDDPLGKQRCQHLSWVHPRLHLL